MRNFVSLMIFFVVSLGNVLYAAGIEKMFVHRKAGDESLFFIFSQKMPACKETKSIAKSIDYDYTYFQKTDSVAMLLTLPLNRTAHHIIADISTDKDTYSIVPELIYADPKNGKIIYRLRLNMSFETFVDMYSSSDPFTISFHYDYSGGDENICFRYDEKKWLSNQKNMVSIIELIKINTGKK